MTLAWQKQDDRKSRGTNGSQVGRKMLCAHSNNCTRIKVTPIARKKRKLHTKNFNNTLLKKDKKREKNNIKQVEVRGL